jgi:predicted MFS family arabinose efflux permease
MNRKARLFLAIIILAISVLLLIWAYSPNPRETRVQPIAPSEMQLP